ncbi:MAG TPA: hypothetical protein DCR63_06610 [Microbacterium sp.]|nr:hypothetical protein [Microbacterium sp.]
MNALAGAGVLIVGLCALATVALLLRAMPRAAFVLWGIVLFFVPVWVGVNAGTFWAAITVVTILAIISCGGSVRLSPIDGFVAAFTVLVVVEFAMQSMSLSATVIALMEWIVPYVWGRLVLARLQASFVTHWLALLTTVAAGLAVVEFVSGVNVFLFLPAQGPSFEEWGVLQDRGGFVRAEGAFGHSIALGASLAMGSAFVVAAPWRARTKVVALGLIGAAAVTTFSRIGMSTLVLAVALSIFTLPGITRATRATVAVAGIVAAAIVIPFLGGVFLTAGQEAGGSASYRGGLLDLVPLIQPLGAARDLEGAVINGQYLGFYASSIDNALLVVALRAGWVPTIVLTVCIIGACLPLLRHGGATAANIAVATQIPSLLTVAFITQYGMYFWFLVGLAVASELRRRAALEPASAVIALRPPGEGIARWPQGARIPAVRM